MARANYDHLIPKIQAEYRTGHYSIRKLADRHDVSVGFVAKHTKHLDNDVAEVVNAGVAYNKALSEFSEHNEHLVNATKEVVDERTKHLMFFNKSALKNQQIANNRLKEKEHDIELSELEAHSRITARNKETLLGKSPETAIQINNTSNSSDYSVEVLKAIKSKYDTD